jgi:hypothetical protein
MTPLRRTLLAVLASSTLALTGCGGATDTSADPPSTSPTTEDAATGSPSSKPSPRKTKPAAATSVSVKVSGEAVTPVAEQVEVGVGEVLELRIDSDRPGELHVHSSPEQLVEFRAGKRTVEITFEKPGQVDIEEHESGVLVARALVQ